MEFPIIDKFAKDVAEKVLDEFIYEGKTIREWVELLAKQEPCDDAISRQAVLDALDKSKYSNEFCEEHHIDWSINLGMAHIVVNELKPITPHPKVGQWVKTFEPNEAEPFILWECSNCHKTVIGSMKSDYCPNCGADMRESEDEE